MTRPLTMSEAAEAMLVIAYIATIPAANWLIGHWGTVCVPNGPCLLPVFPGLMAPSGVLMIGAALVLRDLVQRRYGIAVSLACVGAGAALSAFIAPPALALASGAAFLFSELIDFAVYTPIARRNFAAAIILSCSAGALADSALFLWLAFGSLAFIGGQFVGKLYAALAFIAWRNLPFCNIGWHRWRWAVPELTRSRIQRCTECGKLRMVDIDSLR